MNQTNLANLIWSVAETLRGDFRQSQYGYIILPFTVLRRFECVLEPTRAAVLASYDQIKEDGIDPELVLPKVSGQEFYNISKYQLNNLGVGDTLSNLEDYIHKFSPSVRKVFDQFDFTTWLERLDENNLLYTLTQHFADIDLHPETISNHEMGLAFEHLIRRFAESANDTAGEFYTPRDVVRLATTLVFAHDKDLLGGEGIIKTIYDPTCGTGGFLSSGIEQVLEWNDSARVVPFGQELNAQTHAIAMADMMIKGYTADNIKLGNTLSDDLLYDQRFDYALANPPFGVDWKKVQRAVQNEHNKGDRGRFPAGTPRVSDGSLLFLSHLISKMHIDKPSRIGIVLNGSPLFTGSAGSGESEIRRWILENDWLETIVALPTDMFYNTGIATYVWILSNKKDKQREGKVQLISATGEAFWKSMSKSLGSKRRLIPDAMVDEIARLHAGFENSENSKIFDTEDFGYRRITVERPLQLSFYPHDALKRQALCADKAWLKLDEARQQALLSALEDSPEKISDRDEFVSIIPGKLKPAELKLLQKHLAEHDEEAAICRSKGAIEANPDLRDNENVPLKEAIDAYFEREVLPHVPNAWIDTSKRDALDGGVGIVGYEIPFNRHFYQYQPPRSLETIDAELDAVSRDIMGLLAEVHS